MISIFSNSLGEEELAQVGEVFKSKWLGRGGKCTQFEKAFAEYLNTDETLLTNCCTSSIYIALRTLNIKEGDEVILSTINFVACLSAVLELKAIPVFADVDKRTLNIKASEITRLKTEKTKAVIILHYGGHPAEMNDILTACGDVPLVEDSACSIASTYAGRNCGTIGAAGTWSFDAMKILVTGDGGALWMKLEYRQLAKTLRYLGMEENGGTGMDKAGNGVSRWWEYRLIRPSGRFISNDITATIGLVQLKKLDKFIQRRKEIWSLYKRELSCNVGDLLLPPEPLDGCTSSYYFFWIQTSKRDALAAYLKEKGIYTTFRYYPLHLVQGGGDNLPASEIANEITLNIPLHQNLTDDEVLFISKSIRDFYVNA